MVFTIKSQYIDPVGKLRIIYGVFNSHAINLLTFPSPPLDKIPIEPVNKVVPVEINDAFIKNFKDELGSDQIWRTNTGVWFKNSVFPPFVFIPLNRKQQVQQATPPIPFPLMIQEDPQSRLDAYKEQSHKANIFKQYVLFLYSCDPKKYSLESSFVINENPNYDFEKWNPPNWLSLENKKMFVLHAPISPAFKAPLLSKLTPDMFRHLNAERLQMCFEAGKGECKTDNLPKPTDRDKWTEYRSPGGGHCLFHTILRADAKLNPDKYEPEVDFDTWDINRINKNKVDHWSNIHALRYSIEPDEDNKGVDDAKRRSSEEDVESLDAKAHTHFWGTDEDIQALANRLKICILVFSKHIINKQPYEEWQVFSHLEENSVSANLRNCPPDRAIFINNASGSHYNLLVPVPQEDESDEKKTNIQLIVPHEGFKKRLDFYLQRELQLNKERVTNQKNRETIPNFYKFKTYFTKNDHINIFSSREGVKQWVRYKTTSKEYLKCIVSSIFHPSGADLARLDFLEKEKNKSRPAAAAIGAAANRYFDFQKELLIPYFFYHYQINDKNLSLVQNVVNDEKTFDNNLFQALLVSRLWILYQVNSPVEDLGSLPDLKWRISPEKLKIKINPDNEESIFKEYNVAVYSPEGEKLRDTNEPPEAHLIQYKNGYAALLFVSREIL